MPLLQNSQITLLSVVGLAQRCAFPKLAPLCTSSGGRRRGRRQSPLRSQTGIEFSAKDELIGSEKLTSVTESTLDDLSGLVASPKRAAGLQDELAVAKRRANRAAAIRAASRRYLPAPGAGETSVLLYCAERQAVLLNRTDPELWQPAALAEVFPLTADAARRLLANFVELRWPADIQRRDSNTRLRVWPALERPPLVTARLGLSWLLGDASKLALLRFAAGHPDLAHYWADDCEPRQLRPDGAVPGQMERIAAKYYGDSSFLSEAEAALSSSPAELSAARQELADLQARLLKPKESRQLNEKYKFKRQLERLDFTDKFLYDK